MTEQELEQKIYSHRQAITTYHTDIGSGSITAKSLKEQIAHLYKCPGCGIDIMVSNSKVEKADLKALSQTLVEVEGIKTANLQKVVIEQQAIDKEVLEGKKLDAVIEDFAVAQKTLLQMPKPEDLQPDIDSKTNRNVVVLADYTRLDAEAEQKIGGMQKTLLELEVRLKAIAKPEQTVEDLMRCMDQAKNSVSDYDKLLGNIDSTLKQIKVAEEGRTREGVSATAAKHQADIYGFWETSFNEIKMDIIDEFLPDFEDKVNEYLSRLKVNLRVRFGTQKEKSGASKKDKELGRAFKEEFNVEVFKEDNIPLPYGLLSKGQRSRCGNCVGMALRELTKERGNNVFDFFFLDEVSDSLDESGLRELVNLLDETPGQKLVISHNNFLKDYFNDRIVVEMTNEISTIRQEAA
jgi:DNA repair exonuclease SbcCD ATPase subunit